MGGWIKGACLLSILITFAVLCHYHGDKETVLAIYNSWAQYINLYSQPYPTSNSIGAIGWETIDTLKMHLHINFPSFFAIITRSLFGVLVYYFLMNFLFVMGSSKRMLSKEVQTSFSVILIINFVCALPLFTVLSCDYARIYQYITISSVAALLILPPQTLFKVCSIFPRLVGITERLNVSLNSIIPPSKGLMIVLLLLIAATPVGFNIESALCNSVFYYLLQSVYWLLNQIFY